MDSMLDTPEKIGRGNFFAVDRQAWSMACGLGINAAVAYLVLARGTGGDQRTTSWSTNAVESYTGIARSRAKLAIATLESGGLLTREPERPRDRPRYRLISPVLGTAGSVRPPDWIWLPNAIVDGAAAETAPLELVRQTGDPDALRLLVDLYGSQNLAEDGGIDWRLLSQPYARHRIGQHGALTVWGFEPRPPIADPNAPFVAPHRAYGTASDTDFGTFPASLERLLGLRLIEFVSHLVESDSAEAEIVHPLPPPGIGLPVEQAVSLAAATAARVLITAGQSKWARQHGIALLAPVPSHMTDVQLVGVPRLRYRPRTAQTAAWTARAVDWEGTISAFEGIARRALRGGVAVEPACNIKEESTVIKEASMSRQ